MSALNILDSVLDFYKKNIANTIELQKATERNDQYELVNPSVHEGWIPPEGIIDTHAVPGILISHEKGRTNFEDMKRRVIVVVTYVVYSPGDTIKTGGNYETKLNFKGYRDLVNLMDRAELKLLGVPDIEGFEIDSEIESDIFRESVYPFFYGTHKFTLSESISNVRYKIEL